MLDQEGTQLDRAIVRVSCREAKQYIKDTATRAWSHKKDACPGTCSAGAAACWCRGALCHSPALTLRPIPAAVLLLLSGHYSSQRRALPRTHRLHCAAAAHHAPGCACTAAL